jgi:hypothetical protein
MTGTTMGAVALLDGSKTGDITKTGVQWKTEVNPMPLTGVSVGKRQSS